MRIWHQKSATCVAAMAITLLANTAQGQYLDLPEPGSLGPCFDLQAFKKGYEVVADYDYRSYVEGMAGQYQWTTIVRSMGVANLEGKPVWLFWRQDTERITAPHTTVQYTYVDLDVTKGLKPLAQDVISGTHRQRDYFEPTSPDRQMFLRQGQKQRINVKISPSALDPHGLPLVLPDENSGARNVLQDLRNVSFVGVEDVMVPAGLFPKTCKFDYQNGVIEWIASTGPKGWVVKREQRSTSNGYLLALQELRKVMIGNQRWPANADF